MPFIKRTRGFFLQDVLLSCLLSDLQTEFMFVVLFFFISILKRGICSSHSEGGGGGMNGNLQET